MEAETLRRNQSHFLQNRKQKYTALDGPEMSYWPVHWNKQHAYLHVLILCDLEVYIYFAIFRSTFEMRF